MKQIMEVVISGMPHRTTSGVRMFSDANGQSLDLKTTYLPYNISIGYQPPILIPIVYQDTPHRRLSPPPRNSLHQLSK